MFGLRTIPPILLAILFVGAIVLTPVATPVAAAGCPPYHANLIVIWVDSTPHPVSLGTNVVTTIHATYTDGSAVSVSPLNGTFVWANLTKQVLIKNATLSPTGNPGFYTYTQTVGPGLPTGSVTISVYQCSLRDASGNYGPSGLTNSDTTSDPCDDSHVFNGNVTATVTTTTTTGVPLNCVVGGQPTYMILAIVLLLIVAAILFLRRRRRKT